MLSVLTLADKIPLSPPVWNMSMALEKSVFPHVANSYANLSEQRHVLRTRRGSTPTRLVWDTNMAALFGGGTNMANVTVVM